MTELAEKLARVRRWLDATGFGAALFTSQPGVAWVTGGLEDRVVRNEEPGLAWALVTASGAHLITTSIEAARLLAEADLDGLTLHAVAWHDPGGLAGAVERLAQDEGGLTGAGPKLATDGAGPGTAVPGELAALRLPLVAAEHERLAALGADTAEVLQDALRDWIPTERECDLAARIAAALEERLVFPSVLLVGGARRRRAFRHPVPTAAVTGPDVLAVVTGVRGGLTVSCSRSAAYADAGFPGEWREHVQGGPVGYPAEQLRQAAVIAVTNTPDWPATADGRPDILRV